MDASSELQEPFSSAPAMEGSAKKRRLEVLEQRVELSSVRILGGAAQSAQNKWLAEATTVDVLSEMQEQFSTALAAEGSAKQRRLEVLERRIEPSSVRILGGAAQSAQNKWLAEETTVDASSKTQDQPSAAAVRRLELLEVRKAREEAIEEKERQRQAELVTHAQAQLQAWGGVAQVQTQMQAGAGVGTQDQVDVDAPSQISDAKKRRLQLVELRKAHEAAEEEKEKERQRQAELLAQAEVEAEAHVQASDVPIQPPLDPTIPGVYIAAPPPPEVQQTHQQPPSQDVVTSIDRPSNNNPQEIDDDRRNRSPGLQNNFYETTTSDFKRPYSVSNAAADLGSANGEGMGDVAGYPGQEPPAYGGPQPGYDPLPQQQQQLGHNAQRSGSFETSLLPIDEERKRSSPGLERNFYDLSTSDFKRPLGVDPSTIPDEKETPVNAAPVAAAPVAAAPLARTSVARTPMAGEPMAGAPVAGAPVAGAPMISGTGAGRSSALASTGSYSSSFNSGLPVAAKPKTGKKAKQVAAEKTAAAEQAAAEQRAAAERQAAAEEAALAKEVTAMQADIQELESEIAASTADLSGRAVAAKPIAAGPMAAGPVVPTPLPPVATGAKLAASKGASSSGFYSGQASASMPVAAVSTTVPFETDAGTKNEIEQVETRSRRSRGYDGSEVLGEEKSPKEPPAQAEEASLWVPSGIFTVPSNRWAEFGDMTLHSRCIHARALRTKNSTVPLCSLSFPACAFSFLSLHLPLPCPPPALLIWLPCSLAAGRRRLRAFESGVRAARPTNDDALIRRAARHARHLPAIDFDFVDEDFDSDGDMAKVKEALREVLMKPTSQAPQAPGKV